MKIFNPLAKSCPKSIPDAYTFHESQKRLKYEQKIIEVENLTFNPLVFACTGGAGPTTTRVMKRLAAKICEQKDASYADAIAYIRTKLSFAVFRCSILCIRGCRSTKIGHNQFVDSAIGAIIEEGRLT